MAIVYLHIGAPKTATSSLQSALAANGQRLLDQGVLYPRDIRTGSAHHGLACDLIGKHQGVPMADIWYGSQPRGQAWDALGEEIARMPSGVGRVILSSELFFGQSRQLRPILDEVRSRLSGHEVRVLVYLRRQDQWYSSFYNQDVKGVRQWPHGPYQFYEAHQIFQYDYYSLLKRWSEVFGKENILIRPYEPGQWHEGDILRDFCHTLGIPELDTVLPENQRSLGVHQVYLKQCLNKVGFKPELNDQVLSLLFELIPEAPATECLFVNQRLYRKYRRLWLAVNGDLEREFLGGNALFREPIPESEPPGAYLVNKLVIADFVEKLVARLETEPRAEMRTLFAQAAAIALSEKGLWGALRPGVKHRLTGWL
jgi:hypothetical protein